ncbi:hypothetical protein [Streptomyces sp. NPDC048106]|uniref:hypothetical protein n=1 Tax=Streptomyces sp. NPDC048106 TaxID=3155750 RepID=UPI003453D6AA
MPGQQRPGLDQRGDGTIGGEAGVPTAGVLDAVRLPGDAHRRHPPLTAPTSGPADPGPDVFGADASLDDRSNLGTAHQPAEPSRGSLRTTPGTPLGTSSAASTESVACA